MTGKVLKSIMTDINEVELFKFPRYLTISVEQTGEVLYVSDDGTNTITKLSMEGDVLATYTHKSWRGMHGLTCVGGGQFIVCNYGGHTVEKVSEDGRKVTTLLNTTYGITYTWSLCYYASKKTLC